ncbi:LiaF transmembrane domain-containing protein [Lactiplantibacillus paraxiangfangensis]|uniref:LiaF transmembrane domain-containing protein n=1 Tax=Lactiplantibacillus paraxiangfangensis TaxID=3076224 RepID=UPI0030C71C20
MKRNWFWATFLIVSAVVLVTSQLGLLTVHIGFWGILFTIVLVAALISSLRYLNMAGAVFALAFLAILYARPLGITQLVPWTILGAALLLSIGLSLIIRPRYFKPKNWEYSMDWKKHHHRDSRGTISNANVKIDLSFGNSIRYVHTDQFKTANINVSMAGAKIYFDDVELAGPTAVINLDLSLGSIELYVPSTWQLQMNVTNSMGHIETVGQPTNVGPVVYVDGNLSLGELKIVYI